MRTIAIIARRLFVIGLLACATMASGQPRHTQPAKSPRTLAQFIIALQAKAKTLENSFGMRLGFQEFTSEQNLAPGSVSYSDYVMARLLYEAARDAGFWNLHWVITNHEPNSDYIWRQWRSGKRLSAVLPTAEAECDELSALYAFLALKTGVRDVGLFWPTYNHTVAVWVVHPAKRSAVRVVVPTSQIFLEPGDSFGTKKFNPWNQKSIREYTRRDVADTFEFPAALFDFLLAQIDKYAGASNWTLQQLRHLRDGVFQKAWTPEQAAEKALRKAMLLKPGSPEDVAAFQSFAQDMRLGASQ